MVIRLGKPYGLNQLDISNPVDLNEAFVCLQQYDLELAIPEPPLAYGNVAPVTIKRPFVQRAALLGLPVELRMRIYELCIPEESKSLHSAYDTSKLSPPHQPSITRICRSIREESLDYWYTTVRFPLQFRITGWGESGMGPQSTPNYELVQVAPSSVYSRLRKLEVCFQNTLQMNVCQVCFSVNLNAGTNSYTVEHTPRPDQWWVPMRTWEKFDKFRGSRRIERLERHFGKAIAAMIAECGGVKNLTLHDYQHVVPKPSWRFWEDMPEQEEQQSDNEKQL